MSLSISLTVVIEFAFIALLIKILVKWVESVNKLELKAWF